MLSFKFFCLFLLVSLVAIVAQLSAAPATPPRSCPSPNDELFGNECFEFVELNATDIVTFDSATAYCQSHNKTLAVIRGKTEQQRIANKFTELGWSRALIGLRYLKSAWRWADRAPLVLRGQGCQEDKGIDMAKQANNYSETMSVETCIAFCSRGGHQYAAVHGGLFCYCSHTYIWKQAASQCNIPCPGIRDQLCGSYTNSRVFFTAEFAYDNWKKGRPGVAGSCSAVQVDTVNNEWVDVGCNYARGFLCRYDINDNVPSAGVTQWTCGNNNTCYYLYTTPKLAWADANHFCSKSGGFLATVDSQERQDMVNTLVGRLLNGTQIWIGGSNFDWYYPDQSVPAFSGWISASEPTFPSVHSCTEAVVTTLTTTQGPTFGWKSRVCGHLDGAPNRFICSKRVFDQTTGPGPRRRPPGRYATASPNANYDIDIGVGSGGGSGSSSGSNAVPAGGAAARPPSASSSNGKK